MKDVVWRLEYGVYVPFCPYCDEPAYEPDRCFACGREYHYVDGEHKPTLVSKGEYTVAQSTNNHIGIYKNGWLVRHICCTVKKTEEELLELIEHFRRCKDAKV